MCVSICPEPSRLSPHQALGHRQPDRQAGMSPHIPCQELLQQMAQCSLERAASLTRNPFDTDVPCTSPRSPSEHTFLRPLSRRIRRYAGPVSAAQMHALLVVACSTAVAMALEKPRASPRALKTPEESQLPAAALVDMNPSAAP